MKKLSGIILTLFVIGLLAGCGGGVTKEEAAAVWDCYIDATVAAMKAGGQLNATELQDKAAKEKGFASWKDFSEKVAKSLDAKEQASLNAEKATLLGQKMAEASAAGQ